MREKEYNIENELHSLPICNIITDYCKIFENMDEGVSIFEVIYDESEKVVDLRVNYVNPASILNKLQFMDELIGKTITELFEADKIALYLEMANKVISAVKEIQYETFFAQLNKHYLINILYPHENMCITIEVDITERKRAQEELKEAHDKLEIKVQERTRELEESNRQLKQEIEERKKTEKSLKESEEKFRGIFNNANDMISLHAGEEDSIPGQFIEVNEVGIKRLGYSREEFLNMGHYDIDKEPETPKHIEKILRGGHTRFETVHVTKNGKRIPTEINTHMIDCNGRKVSLCISRDITERKKAEKALKESETKFRELFNKAPDMITLVELNENKTFGKLIEVNEAAINRLGYSKEELLNIVSLDLMPEINAKMLQISVEFYKKGYATFESVSKTKDIKEFPAEINAHLFKLEGKDVVLAIVRDITERKKMEESIIKSRNYLDKIINSIADPVFVKDKEHRWVLLNDSYCDFMGYPREELLGKSDYDFFPSHEADVFWEKDEEVFKTGVENVNEEEFTDSDGNVHIIVTKKTLYSDISGEKYIVAVIRDITELKKVENNLRKSEGRLEIAMDMAKLAYWEADMESRMFTFDDRFYALYGTTAEQEGGMQMSGEEYARRFIPPEERYIIAEEMVKALKTDDPDFTGQIEHSIIRADGEKRFIVVHFRSIKDDEGRVIKTYGANQDITELKKAGIALKESEKKFRELFNKALDIIILVEVKEDGTSGKFIEVNEAAIKRLGYSKKEFLNMEPVDLLVPESHAEMPQIAVELQKRDYITFEGINITKDGKKIPVESNIHIFKLGGKKVALAIARDITERKKAEKQLKETVEELKRSNKELKQFTYVSSHDLQEPLRTITSFTQLLERRYKGKLDEDADEFIGYIVEAAVHMKAQIEALLEYSRVATKGENFKLVDMNLILNHTIQTLDTSIKEANAETTCDKLPSVMGNAGHLQRVFQNLISNAVRFRKYEEPLKIHISAYKSKDENEYVFSIQDNGIGIEEQYYERIFTIFQRLHTRDEYHSTGIGLSIVKRIIERYGGRVWVESEFGVGSVFYFTIPILSNDFQ